LAWARFLLIEETATASGGSRVRIADLRYHLGGAPTLAFEIDLDAGGTVTAAHLHRCGTAKSLL
jgi:inner membrane protein